MDKTHVDHFQQDVCTGEAGRESTPCEHAVAGDADTGRPLVDLLARVETTAIGTLAGNRQLKCGLCGCPLANLSAFDLAPAGCPRLADHR